MKKTYNYHEEIKINRFKISDAASNQSDLFLYYAELYAESKEEVGNLKRKLKTTKADIELNYRKNPPSDFKITEASISALLDSNEKIESIEKEIIEAEYNSNILAGVVEAFRQRKSMIELLFEIQKSIYFASPKEKGEKGIDFDEKQVQNELLNDLNEKE